MSVNDNNNNNMNGLMDEEDKNHDIHDTNNIQKVIRNDDDDKECNNELHREAKRLKSDQTTPVSSSTTSTSLSKKKSASTTSSATISPSSFSVIWSNIFDNERILLFDDLDTTNNNKIINEWKNTFINNLPYPHICIKHFFNNDFLELVKNEMKLNSKVNYKESDLFRVYQSIDMANLDDYNISSKLPNVLQLRNVLYSTEFCMFVENVCDLPINTLINTNQIDCAFNCHTSGCHLLCHDDVIGTRKVSYIIYLTDEDNDTHWNINEGGALELYDSTISLSSSSNNNNNNNNNINVVRIPNTIPSKLILPIWNSMVLFVVEPGKSFHAVQEVFGTRPRLSLQGWFHTAAPPNNIHDATLNRLKTMKQHPPMYKSVNSTRNGRIETGNDSNYNSIEHDITNEYNDNDEEDTEGHYIPFNNNNNNNRIISTTDKILSKLTNHDMEYLLKFINPIYLQYDNMYKIQKKFEMESSIELRDFLIEPLSNNILLIEDNKITTTTTTEHNTDVNGTDISNNDQLINQIYNIGVTDEWKIVGPSHKQRFLQYVEETNKSKGDKKTKMMMNDAVDDASNTNNTTVLTIGQKLHCMKVNVMQSEIFCKYLSIITNLGIPEGYRGKIRRFRRGLDYTVAHYGLLMNQSVLDATLCFVVSGSDASDSTNNENDQSNDDKKENGKAVKKNVRQTTNTKDSEEDVESDDEMIDENDVIWQSGDCGGFECYIEADDDAIADNNNNKEEHDTVVATDEYHVDDDTNLLSVHACNNTLSLVYRDPGTMRFIKYVSKNAPSSRWDISMEYQVPIDDDDNDDDIDPNHDDSNIEEDDDDDDDFDHDSADDYDKSDQEHHKPSVAME